MPPTTRNGDSRHNSPIRDNVGVLASSSEESIKEMLVMLLDKMDVVDRRMNDMQGDINAVQGEFTTLHEDMALLRDQMEHNSSIPHSHQAGVGNRSNRSHEEESEAAYSHHRSHHRYDNEEDWRRRQFHNQGGREGGRGPNRFNGNHRGHNRDGYGGEGHRYDNPTKNFKHTIPEFHGKFEPDTYLEWESQVDKIFSVHNYSEEDKVKLAITEFREHANTWWSDLMRRRRATR